MKPRLPEIQALFKKLSASRAVSFPAERQMLDAPNGHGVYLIYSPKGKILHVGRTLRGRNGLRQRLYNHLANSSSFSKKYLKGKGARLRNGYSFKYLVVASPKKRAYLEAYATGVLCPLHIGTGAEEF